MEALNFLGILVRHFRLFYEILLSIYNFIYGVFAYLYL